MILCRPAPSHCPAPRPHPDLPPYHRHHRHGVCYLGGRWGPGRRRQAPGRVDGASLWCRRSPSLGWRETPSSSGRRLGEARWQVRGMRYPYRADQPAEDRAIGASARGQCRKRPGGAARGLRCTPKRRAAGSRSSAYTRWCRCRQRRGHRTQLQRNSGGGVARCQVERASRQFLGRQSDGDMVERFRPMKGHAQRVPGSASDGWPPSPARSRRDAKVAQRGPARPQRRRRTCRRKRRRQER